MTLRSVLSEAARNLCSGTTHAAALAVMLAGLMLLCAGVDLASIMALQRQADEFVASGGSTYTIAAAGRIDGGICDSLASLDGVLAAGAIRQSDARLTFAALPSTGVPVSEVTPGGVGLFAASDAGIDDTAGGGSTGGGSAGGVWLSAEAAEPFGGPGMGIGQPLALADGGSVDVAGVYQWPDDGRRSGFAYAAIAPVPLRQGDAFDQCWVKAWPVPDGIEALLRLTLAGDMADGQDPPITAQLNTTHGLTPATAESFTHRISAWAPGVLAATALCIGMLAARARRLEIASALHCGAPTTAMVAQMAAETLVWSLAAVLISSPLLAWMWLDAPPADAVAMADTLIRVPVAAFAGTLTGTALGTVLIRERHLFRYFKNR